MRYLHNIHHHTRASSQVNPTTHEPVLKPSPPMVGDIFNQGTWKVTLKIYNLLQPPLIFLILSMDCRASHILSTLLTRTYLSVNGVVL